MVGLTVEDLLRYFMKEYKKGHGDYKVFVTDDEEANGYHALYYSGQAAADMDSEDRECAEETNHDLLLLTDRDKAIYIG